MKKIKIVKISDDEIGDLVDSFNRMVAGIKLMIGETKRGKKK